MCVLKTLDKVLVWWYMIWFDEITHGLVEDSHMRIDANLNETVSGWVMCLLKSGLLEFGGERSSCLSSSTSLQLTSTQFNWTPSASVGSTPPGYLLAI